MPKKAGREEVKPVKVPSLHENMSRSNGMTIDIPFDKSKQKKPLPKSKPPSPAKQRHVFAFEKKIQLENGKQSSSKEGASRQSSRGSKRERCNEDD
jgi:hypothetical protein